MKVMQIMLFTQIFLASSQAEARFLTPDPVKPSPNAGQNFNRYWYADNNPVKNVDPDGRQTVKIIEPKPMTPEAKNTIENSKTSVKLTADAIKKGGTTQQVNNLKKWNVTIDATAKSAPKTGGIAETQVGRVGDSVVEINTTYSQRINEVGEGSGAIEVTGANTTKGDAGLLVVGLHEYAGHGNIANGKIVNPIAREKDAANSAFKVLNNSGNADVATPAEIKP